MTILEEANEPTAVAVPPRRVKSDGKSSAQHRADAVEPPLRGENPLGQALHIAGGGWQKTLPHARRRPGSGAPLGNKNALKIGLFTREAIEQRRRLRALIGTAARAKDAVVKPFLGGATRPDMSTFWRA